MTTDLFNQGLAALKAGNYAEARRLFTENEDKAGTTAKTKELVREAEAALFAGKVDVAAQALDQVLDRNPSIPEAYLGLARIALFTGQKADARTHATAATKIAPQQGIAWTLLGLVDEADGNDKAALANLEKGAQLGPKAFLCLFNLGRYLASVGRHADGVPYLVKAIDLDPKNPDGHMVLGLTYRQMKQYEKAIKSVERAKDLMPKNPDGWATLADLLFDAKEFVAAKQILDNGLASVGDHPALLEKALACTMMLDDPKAGLEYIERELKVVPNHEQGWMNLAQLALMTGDWDKSEQAARALLEKNPKSWEAWFHLGNLFDAVPDDAKAEEAYRNALKLAPDEWRVIMNLATNLLQQNAKAKHVEAKNLLIKAKGAVPAGEWRAHYNLALAHVRLGEKKEALALTKEIQAKAPKNDPMVDEAKKLESNLKEQN